MWGSDPNIFWLNVTNIVLGLVTLACVLAVAVFTVQEVMERVRNRGGAEAGQDDHAFALPELGMTMADGGDRSEEEKESR